MLGLVGRRCQNGCVAGGGGGGLEAVGVPFSVSPVRKERRAAQRESVPLSTTSWITVSAPSDHTRSINEAWFLSVISSP